MKNISIKTVVATGIGAALFVVIGFIYIPTLVVPNTSIQLQYAVQALFSTIFGPFVGFLVGFIGHTVKDAVQFGSPWWSWIIASGIFGLVLGFLKKKLRVEEGIFTSKDVVFFNVYQILANVVAWGLIAPVLDIVIYSEPVKKVFAQGLVATIVNGSTVAVGGTILLTLYSRSRVKEGSLSKAK